MTANGASKVLLHFLSYHVSQLSFIPLIPEGRSKVGVAGQFVSWEIEVFKTEFFKAQFPKLYIGMLRKV